MHPDECRHRMRVGLGGQRYLCLSCGERWKQAYRGKAPQVPPGWEGEAAGGAAAVVCAGNTEGEDMRP
jgi:hypothetical protein